MEFKKEEFDEILNIFQQESAEIISSMDDKLLLLEKNPEDLHIAIQLFRDAHSLKGSARMLGFEGIQSIVHKIEDIINLIKENKLNINQDITDTISDCLEYVSVLINKTVENKQEYKDDKNEKYIQKLIELEEKYTINYSNYNAEEENIDKKLFLQHFDNIEKLIIELLTTITKARKEENYSQISQLNIKIENFIKTIEDDSSDILNSIKEKLSKTYQILIKYESEENKELAFLEINNSIDLFIETVSNYTVKERIQSKNYWEIVDENINKKPIATQIIKEDDKVKELIKKLPLLEINVTFFTEAKKILLDLIQNEIDKTTKTIYENIKEILDAYIDRKQTLNHDVNQIIFEALRSIKLKDKNSFPTVEKKLEISKTMIKFQEKTVSKKKQVATSASQKEILTSISNTTIKTLRIDSYKLDNLVGELGELIVSRVKTNEQLSLAKQIANNILEWQKNFSKIGYYVKYFDKKYLSNIQDLKECNKIIEYNKQLSALIEQHSEKISEFNKEISTLYKQLQESETQLNTTTREIEIMVKNMRILPLSTIFQLFPRMVHNIAREKGKKIDLVIDGDDVSADKTIIEEIKIPLMHIIRNAIDHGIEDVETRKNLNKNPIGKIIITANYKENNIVIDVKDDGKGLDTEKIRKKALEKKLLTQEELTSIEDEELTNLIFYPGFSTEDFVTELSGRGLGLDIVNNKINELQGRIDVFSQLNQGTIVRITLPATIATTKVFIIQEGEQYWAIENSVIKTIARISEEEIFEKDGHDYYIYNNSAISIFSLSKILSLKSKPKKTNKFTLLIIETDNTIFGIIVEKLISDQEIVHKKLSPPLYKVKNILGITTLANGEACLILNTSDIIKTINSKKIKNKITKNNKINKIKNPSEYKILIVDDSYTTRVVQQNILNFNGYNTISSSNPISALEKIKKEKFNIIITDIQMPKLGGIDFVKKIRNLPNYKQTPIIIVSSLSKNDYLKEMETYNISYFIEKKSFKQQEFLGIINKLL